MLYRLLPFALLACAGKTPEPGDTGDAPTSTTDTTDPCRSADCSSTDTVDTDTGNTTVEGGASLLVTFSIKANLIGNMDEPAQGAFYGEVFRTEDVNLFGPVDGAVALGEIEIADLVLPEDGSATDVLFTLSPVPPLDVTILGFLDSDGNSDPGDPGPDNNDPVTLPNQNAFQLQPDVENVVEVVFGLLNP